jgi:hypothetical protein
MAPVTNGCTRLIAPTEDLARHGNPTFDNPKGLAGEAGGDAGGIVDIDRL